MHPLAKTIGSFVCIAACYYLVGCATTTQSDQAAHLEPFPDRPHTGAYLEAPIVKKLPDGNYEVTPQFVNNSILLSKYANAVDNWKTRNPVQ